MRQRYYEDVVVGEEIEPLVVTVDERQLFFFSAATYNGHRIHYDLRWARDMEGHPNIVVSGSLQSALLAKAVTDWMGPEGRLLRISRRNLASAFPGEELRFVGRVVAKREVNREAIVDLDLHEEKSGGELLMPGSATVALPRRISLP